MSIIDPQSAIDSVAATLQYTLQLYEMLKPQFLKLIESKSDRFLNYDPSFLLDQYAHEYPVSNGIAYSEVCDFSHLAPLDGNWQDSYVCLKVNAPYTQSQGGNDWCGTASAGYTALKDSGRISGNESAIRISAARCEKGCLSLSIQKACYHDQARSNLILDFDRLNPNAHLSLRTQLKVKYGEKLPRLSDARLANTLGVAALLFYRNNGQWVPYIVRRAIKIGVFPGGLHCSASGVARWPNNPRDATFTNFATRHMLFEINEEVGLKEDDLIDLRPIALCREMARGGKPQLFYAGFTSLGRNELATRRKHARKVIKATNQWEEIERDRWYRSADVVFTPARLQTQIGKWGVTLEGAAALHYGLIYAKGRLSHLSIV